MEDKAADTAVRVGLQMQNKRCSKVVLSHPDTEHTGTLDNLRPFNNQFKAHFAC